MYSYPEQLGIGGVGDRSTPMQVIAPSDGARWAEIKTGTVFTCGLRTPSNALYCFGNNDYGSAGSNGTTSSYIPVLTSAPSDGSSWSSFAIGDRHACAIRALGTLYCW